MGRPYPPKNGAAWLSSEKGHKFKAELGFSINRGFVFACCRDLFRAAGVKQSACTEEMSSREDAKALLIIRNK